MGLVFRRTGNTVSPAENRPGAGIVLVTAGVFCITVNDAVVKYLGEIYPVTQLVFFRMLFALPLIVGLAFIVSGRRGLVTDRPLFHAGRGVLICIAAYSFFWGLTLLPLAEVTAIAFSAPLFVTLLAVLLLGERPGLSQWIVTIIGFIGILLIVRPGADTFTFAALVPMLTALAYACFMLSARLLRRDERIWTTMSYATFVAVLISGAALPWVWQTPAGAHMPFFIASGILGGMGITLISQGFRVASASLVAPFDYTGMIWAVLFGWIFWNEIPTEHTILGGMIIAGCGIYLAWKHGKASRRKTVTETLPPP